MRKHFLAAVAAVAIATPAFAADGPYVGVEGGVTFPQKNNFDVDLTNPTTTTHYADGFQTKYKTGYDVDLLAGYKLGLIRLEAEGGYKRAKVKSFGVSTPLLTDATTAAGAPVTAANFDAGNHIGLWSLMGNALLDSDFGAGSKLGGYIGGGAGRAWASYAGDKDSAWAFQGIAGLRYALSPNIDAGIKYRYFRTGKLNFSDAFTVNNVAFATKAKDNYSSNSVLASLVYNFKSREAAAPAPAAPPPPPLPPAPATQTCPDGSVIEATATCPAPPPPPPPPPAPAQRGERG
jgi:OmpA-OmpF porin, OOP family